MRAWVAGLAVLAAACSKGSSDRAATAKTDAPKVAAAGAADACSLVTASEAHNLLGGSTTQLKQDGGSAGYDQCQYTHEGAHIADMATLTIQRLPVGLAAKRQALATNGDKFEEVAGVGDGALWVPGMSFLYVGHGNETLVASIASNSADTKAKSIELARLALPRM